MGSWSLNGKDNQFKIKRVNGSLFHDIFEINRNYLENGELVDLHDDYSTCKCYLSDDGLFGFAIEPDGNLVSVFSLNLLDNGEGTMYLLDHTDREGIENRNPKKEDGFSCRLKFSTDGYTEEEINTIKDKIENGNIRD